MGNPDFVHHGIIINFQVVFSDLMYMCIVLYDFMYFSTIMTLSMIHDIDDLYQLITDDLYLNFNRYVAGIKTCSRHR